MANPLEKVVDWAKAHPLPAAGIAGVGLAVVAAVVMGGRKKSPQTGEYVVPNVLTPGAGGGFGDAGPLGAPPGQESALAPWLQDLLNQPAPTQSPQSAPSTAPRGSVPIAGTVSPVRTTSDLSRVLGITRDPVTAFPRTVAGMSAPTGSEFVSGTWINNQLVAGSYRDPTSGTTYRVDARFPTNIADLTYVSPASTSGRTLTGIAAYRHMQAYAGPVPRQPGELYADWQRRVAAAA